MNRQLKSFKSSMSEHILPAHESPPRGSARVQQLQKENQMKEAALKKANNLIELLNIELEVERNSHQESVRQAEEQIIAKYQRQNYQLREKVTFLEREVKAARMHTAQNEKTIRKSVLTRANSSKSVEHVKKRTVNQKYTEAFEDLPVVVEPTVNFEAEIYKKQAMELEEWRQDIMQLLNTLIKEEYDELEEIVGGLEGMGEEYEKISSFKPKNRKKVVEELHSIIQSQTGIINSLKNYCQELEDICKGLLFKFNSILLHAPQPYPNTLILEEQLKQASKCMSRKKQQWKQQRSLLQSENTELKHILDSMIKLVREQKKHK